jgi:hypothetical protein
MIKYLNKENKSKLIRKSHNRDAPYQLLLWRFCGWRLSPGSKSLIFQSLISSPYSSFNHQQSFSLSIFSQMRIMLNECQFHEHLWGVTHEHPSLLVHAFHDDHGGERENENDPSRNPQCSNRTSSAT